MNSKVYEIKGYKHKMDLLINLALILCFVDSAYWQGAYWNLGNKVIPPPSTPTHYQPIQQVLQNPTAY